MAKVKFMLEEATNRRGCLVELPWSKGEASFVLTCQWDKGVDQPVWSLYESNEGTASKVVWTQSFAPSDLEFMYDILVMSAPKSTGLGSSAIPDLLKPTNPKPPPEEGVSHPTAHEPTPYPSVPSGIHSPAGGLGSGLTPGIPQPNVPPPTPASSYHEMPAFHPQTSSGIHPQYQAPYQAPLPGAPYGAPLPGAPMPGSSYPYQAQMPVQPGMPYQQAPYPAQMPPQQMSQQMQLPPQGYLKQPQIQPQADQSPKIPLDYHLLDKRPNVLLGTMLQEAGLISEPTLEAALKLQELVREEKMAPECAPHVLKRLHAMGGKIDQYLTPADTMVDRKPADSAPKPQPQSALQQAPDGQQAAQGKRNLKPAFDLLQTAGILTEEDIKVALEVRKKHGGELVGILEAAGKVSRKTVDAAFICLPLIREGLLKVEQCIIALNYCSRMRVGFDEALDEMGWQNPRKLRSDLPL